MKVRVKFSKRGVLKYIGHLDLMRYFQKAFRRTNISVLYSKGFSPHMIMSFAQPLGVGVESDGEYFDVEVDDSVDMTTFVSQLNEQMAEGITVLEATVLPDDSINAMASVAAAAYEINFHKENPLSESMVSKFLSEASVNYTKTTKKGEHDINVKDYVFDIKLLNENTLYAVVDCSSAGNLKPSILCEALLGFENKNIADFPFHVLRKDTYMRNADGELVPLNKF